MLMFQGINSLRQHVRPEIRMHGKITDGGGAPNIIHEHAGAVLYVRAPKHDQVLDIARRVEGCARGAALMTDTQVDVEYGEGYLDMLNNETLGKAFLRNLNCLNIPVDSFRTTSTASTDMGDVSYRVPTIYPVFQLGAGLPHTREFLKACDSQEGVQAMFSAARGMALTVYDLLSTPQLIEDIKKEFARSSL
jgi:metal-dependent amidase/aminoacylase/carboxypeptidase family protein